MQHWFSKNKSLVAKLLDLCWRTSATAPALFEARVAPVHMWTYKHTSHLVVSPPEAQSLLHMLLPLPAG